MNDSGLIRILHLEDNHFHANLVQDALAEEWPGCVVVHADTESSFSRALEMESIDVILADMVLPTFDGREALAIARQNFPDIPFIFVSGTMGEETAVETLKSGATDFVLKSHLSRLVPSVVRALRESREHAAHLLAVKALRASEAKYRNLYECMMDGFVMVDMDGVIRQCNDSYLTMLGYSLEELLGRPSRENTPEKWHVCEQKIVEDQILRQGYSTVYEKEYRKKDGTVFPVELRMILVKDDAGVNRGMWAIVRDISERKNLEKQLMQAQKMEAVGTLAGGIAHDFNNILTVFTAYCTLIDRKLAENNPVRPYLDKLLASVDRATTLTRSLLAYSREQPVNPQPVDLNAIVVKVDSVLSRLLGENVDLVIRPANGSLIVLADSRQIEQVLMNLATNARDAMLQGGVLRIVTSRLELMPDLTKTRGCCQPGSYALATVSDSGSGMDEITRERIFEPFFTTKEVDKGTGLGLAIAYGIIKQHNGYINVYSEPGNGTTFTIYLPLTNLTEADISPPKHSPHEADLPVGR
jgi:PAS domain S-box-containing protein